MTDRTIKLPTCLCSHESDPRMLMNTIQLIGTFIIGILSWFVPQADFIRKQVVLEVLWPRSAKFKEFAAVPMLKLDNVKRSMNDVDKREIAQSAFDDFELAISGVNFEVKWILECLFENALTFHLKDIDYFSHFKNGN